MSAKEKKSRSKGILIDKDWKDMLASFPKMSLHDQAAIFLLIQSRATANVEKTGRAA